MSECKSIVIDATNNNIKKREIFVNLAREYKYDVRCIFVSTSFNVSYQRNCMRDHVVPKIAYYVYKKKFEQPNEREGFTLITV